MPFYVTGMIGDKWINTILLNFSPIVNIFFC